MHGIERAAQKASDTMTIDKVRSGDAECIRLLHPTTVFLGPGSHRNQVQFKRVEL